MLARSAMIIVCAVSMGFAPALRAEVVEKVDLHTDGHGGERYYVVFCARKSQPWGSGHCFVVWVKQDLAAQQVQSQGFGFYPKRDRVVFYLLAGEGRLADEGQQAPSVNRSLLTHRLIVQVDRNAFQASLALKDKWKQQRYQYNLVSRNCMHFAYAVSRTVGLHSPKPNAGERPPQYLSRLMQRVR